MNADVIEKFERRCADLMARKNELERQAAEIAAEIASQDTELQEAETIRSMMERFIGSEPVGTVEAAPPVVEPDTPSKPKPTRRRIIGNASSGPHCEPIFIPPHLHDIACFAPAKKPEPEPVIVPPVSAKMPAGDASDGLADLRAAIQRIGLKVAADFTTTEMQEEPASEELDEAEDDPDDVLHEDRVAVVSIFYGENLMVHWKVDGRELHFRRWSSEHEDYQSFKREGRRDKYAILRAALRRAHEEDDQDVSFSHDEYALIEALAAVDGWLTTGQLWKLAEKYGYSKSRTSVLNDLCDGKKSLMNRYPNTIMRVKDHAAVTWRML